jgi:L-alanine-DL-glutamate epimerase-like enolase superfamily enzyme
MNRRVFVRSLAAGAAFIAGGCHHRGLLAGEPERKETQPMPEEGPQTKPLGETATQELSEHRIARIEAHQSNDRYPRSVGRNSGGNPVGRGSSRPIRILIADKGARGGAMSGISEEQAQKFIGARVSDLFDVARGAVEAAYPIELPLYDLVGNILKMPVCGLLGAAGPREVPIYSGSIYFDDLDPPETPRGVPGVLASCQQDFDAGYRAFKLKIGRGFKWIPGDVFNLDLGIVGYTRWRQVMPELVQAGVQASPHTWAGTPRPYYAAHLAAGIGNVAIVEGIPGTATGLDYSAYRFADGKLVVPDAPGFGIGLSF